MDGNFALKFGAKRIQNVPGKTSSRLIKDLLEYDPRYPRRSGRNMLRDPAPQYRGTDIARKGPLDCRHTLMRKDGQTNAPKSNIVKFDGSEEWTVAAYCGNCRYHFTITADYLSGSAPCNLSDEANPLHHLQLFKFLDAQEYVQKHGESKYDAVTESHHLKCSGDNCKLDVEIKISPPRLNAKVLEPILNPAKVNSRGQREIADNPERYVGFPPINPLQALSYLRSYLLDARTNSEISEDSLRPIAMRNKKYMLAFGDECDALFEYLDFKHFQDTLPDSADDEEPSHFWRPPRFNSENRDFFSDVLIELELQILNRPNSERNPTDRPIQYRPIPALREIELSLGCFDYPTRLRTVDLSGEEHPYYASLGAVDNFTDEILSWAYDRQCKCDPSNKPYYFDCLEDLATGRKSTDLQLKVVMATSAGQFGLKAIEDSYNFFGLEPDSIEEDDHIMGLYKSRIESAPRQKQEAKDCLLIIGKARNSYKIEALANDKTMTLDEALEFFSVSQNTASDSIEAVAIAMALDGDKEKVVRALRVIANERAGDYALQKAASLMESGSGESTLAIGDAYNRLQIPGQNASDDTIFAYYKSLSDGAAAGSKDSFTEALRTIAHDRQSAFLLRKLDDPDADVQAEPGTADQPVGLDNIGNTCYLNSLLQYYYTIKPVRDVVMNFEQYRMDLTENELKGKRAGGRLITKAEVVKGQKFMKEMHNLFENLKSSSTRSIKPTRELAELSFFTQTVEDQIRRASVTSPHGPPSIASIMNGPVFGPEGPPPPVPSRPSPKPTEEDIEMVDSLIDKILENVSDTSELTLVDTEPLPSYDETRINGDLSQYTPIDTADGDDDVVMANGQNQIHEAVKPFSAPENPPPVPPRNKSGLVIQTNEIIDLASKESKWTVFGTQQDVDEVIRNVVFRMQCAIKPESTDQQSGEQTERITDTFYGKHAYYTEKVEKLERKVEIWSSILVWASKTGPRDIYEALDVVFDAQKVEVENTVTPQYTSIDKLPPILQIQISRTDYDLKRNVSYKIQNPVTFPETLYLDRYMDSKGPDSVLMRRRRQTWDWKDSLKILEARQAALSNEGAGIDVAEALLATKEYIIALQEEEIDGIEIDPLLPDSLDERITEVGAELEQINREISSLKQNLNEQFMDMRDYEYKLQAVFIHRGEAGGGHYWIYIYDFKNDIWREYNDEYVTIVKDRKRIFEQQQGGGTPYYLVYVRSSDREELVEPVFRDVQEVHMTDVSGPWVPNMEDEGIVMIGVDNDDNEGKSRHVEHARPRPLRPKPTVQDVVDCWDTSAKFDRGLDANGLEW